MTIPDFQALMLPLLGLASKYKEFAISDVIQELAMLFNLSERERNRLLPSGKGRTFLSDRIHWAIMYLKHAGLLERTKKGHYRITGKGQDVLKNNPKKIDKNYLKRYPEFVKYIK